MAVKPLPQTPILAQAVDKTTRNAFTDVHSRVNQLIKSSVSSSDVVTTATANKILKLDANAKLPASITGVPLVWQPNHAYAVGDICYSPNAPSYTRMECVVAGTSGTTEPTWPAVGQTVTDGTVTWIVSDIRAVVNPKFLIDSEYAFTRSSVAYKQDGTQVVANQPRFETGKFVKAIMVEEGTTNLFADPLFNNFSSTWVFYDYGSGTGTKTAANNVVTLTGGTSGSYIYQRVGTNGVVYSLSCLARKLDGSSVTTSDIKAVYSNVVYNFDNIVPLANGWYLCTAINHPSTANTWGVYCPANKSIMVKYPQMEQKPYPTSFIDGTRSPETLTIPTAGVLNPQEGTVECWVYVDPNVHKATGSYWNMVFVVADSNETNQLRFGYNRASGNWHVKTSDSAGAFWLAEYTVASGWHHFALTWNKAATTAKMYVDGVVIASNTAAPLPSAFASVAYIGSWINGGYQLNSLIDDFRISSRARTDAEILATYQSGLPSFPDKDTTWWSKFDFRLLYT